MSRKPYARVSEEDKAKALKRHLLEKVPVSTICEELSVAPNLFYTWQQRLFEEAPNVLSRTRKGGGGRSRSAQEQRVITLEARLRQREEALAELMTEYVALKKRSTGEA